MVKVLTREGYETLEADDGRSALALARRLKADPQTADIPIIALTAFALQGDEERAREAGCDGYLSKPCRPKTIREAAARFLAGH